jgi:xanthine/uracil permease
MTLIGWIVAGMLLIVVIGTIVDIFRQHYSTGATVGWVVLVIILPFIGSAIYWVARKPEPTDPEQLYRLEAEQRREAARRPGMGP